MKIGYKIAPFHYRLREARLKKGLSQKRLASLTGVRLETISRLETLTQHRVSPRLIQELDDLAYYLRIPYDELFPPEFIKALKGIQLPDKSTFIVVKETQFSELTNEEQVLLLENPSDDIDDKLTLNRLHNDLEVLLSEFPERTQKIMRMRYGLDDGNPHTLQELGEHFHLTRERIRSIEMDTLQQLRHPKRVRKLRNYIDYVEN